MSFYKLAISAFLMLLSVVVSAEKLDYKHSSIYLGDLDGDGIEDLYVRGNDYLVLLHGDVITPVEVQVSSVLFSGSLYQIGSGGYLTQYETRLDGSGVEWEFVDDDELDIYGLVKLNKDVDYKVGDFDGDGVEDLIITTEADKFTSLRSVKNAAGTDLSEYYGTEPYKTLIVSGDSDPLATRLTTSTTQIANFSSLQVRDLDGDGRDSLTKVGNTQFADEMLDYDGAGGFSTRYYYGVSKAKAASIYGASSGSFRVNEQGQATYSIPLSLPAGVAGVAPEFSLDYSSGGGSGLLGMGWGLSGTSSITRCRPTGSDYHSALPLNIVPIYCLDGQRLKAVSDTRGVEVQFKTLIDSYQRITGRRNSDGDIYQFLVESKDGSVRYYGTGVDGDNSAQLGTGRQIRALNLASFVDSVGNKINYIYEGQDKGALRLSKVLYAYDSGGSKAYAEVEFIYENRPDVSVAYTTGLRAEFNKRLQKVIVRNAEPLAGITSPVEIRSYNLGYQRISPDTYPAVSYLEYVQECVESKCLPETRFEWATEGGLEFSEYSSGRRIVTDKDAMIQMLPFDFDGDGLLDLAWLQQEKSHGVYYFSIHYARYDEASGEYKDVHFVGGSNHENSLLCAKGLSAAGREELRICLDPRKPGHSTRLSTVDYNGDGLHDLLVHNEYLGVWRLYPAVLTGNADAPVRLSNVSTVIAAPSSISQLVDVDANGTKDIVYMREDDPSGIWVSELDYYSNIHIDGSEAGVYRPAKRYEILNPPLWDEKCNADGIVNGKPVGHSWLCFRTDKPNDYRVAGIGDFNGDGVEDVVLEFVHYDSLVKDSTYKSGDKPHFTRYKSFIAIRVPAGFQIVEELQSYEIMDTPERGQLWTPDINGDGLTDVAYVKRGSTSESVLVYRLNLGGNLSSGDFGTAWGQEVTLIRSKKISGFQVQFSDLDADGDADLQVRTVDQEAAEEWQKISTELWGQTFNFYDSSWQLYSRSWDAGSESYSEPVMMDLGDGIIGANERFLFYDVNGDSHPDYLNVSGNHLSVRLNTHSGLSGVMTEITNGLGAKTKINYELQNRSSHYRGAVEKSSLDPDLFYRYVNVPFADWKGLQESGQSYSSSGAGSFMPEVNGSFVSYVDPFRFFEARAPYRLVTSVSQQSPVAGENALAVNQNKAVELQYFYETSLYQGGGRGMLGFQRLTTLDVHSGVKTSTNYRQDWPFVGQVTSTTQYAANGAKLSETKNSYSLRSWDSTWRSALQQSSGTWVDTTAPFRLELDTTAEFVYYADTESENNPVSVRADGRYLSAKLLQFEYDEYGNNLKTTTRIFPFGASDATGGTTTIVENTYDKESPGIITFNDGRVRSYPELGRLVSSMVTTKGGESTFSDGVTARLAERMSVAEFSYHATGSAAGLLYVEKEPDADGLVVYFYDDFGNPTRVGSFDRATAYDFSGTVVSNLGQDRIVDSQYDELGRYKLYEKVTHDGLTVVLNEVLERHISGQPTRIRNNSSNELYTDIGYDELGREISRSDSSGAGVTTEYLPCSSALSCPTGAVNKVVKTVRGGGKSINYFDKLGRVQRKAATTLGGALSCVDYEYDDRGNVKRESQPFYCSRFPGYWVENKYDDLGRIVQVSVPDENGVAITKTLYNGLTNTVINPNGQKKVSVSDLDGRLLSVTDALGGRVRYEYDVMGNLRFTHTEASIASLVFGNIPERVTVEMRYDKLGRKVEMLDPDKGHWSYRYNGFDELVWQRDAKGQVVTNSYDSLARLTDRVDYRTNGTIASRTRWYFGAVRDDGVTPLAYNGLQASAIVMSLGEGALSCEASNIECRHPEYDSFGRNYKTNYRIEPIGYFVEYSTELAYDQYGRVEFSTDAMGKAIQHSYDPYSGVLVSSTDVESQKTFYNLLSSNERGQPTKILRGNGLTSTLDYWPETGRLKGKSSGATGGVFDVQNLMYKWDKLGNLASREDRAAANNTLGESFCYDSLNRLVKTYRQAGSQALCSSLAESGQDLRYDFRGNILSKAGVGNYSYDPKRPHAVSSINGLSWVYDANGNLETNKRADGKVRFIGYTTFDKPYWIHVGSSADAQAGGAEYTTIFYYGIDRQRFARSDYGSSANKRIAYLGNVERILHNNKPDQYEWKRYLDANTVITEYTDLDGKPLAGGANKRSDYLYKDHLGSVDAVTNESGIVKERMSFNAWGQRRSGENWSDYSKAQLYDAINKKRTLLLDRLTSVTSRGYTGHEMLDEVGLIHMNGRIYDPYIGRFVQADPIIQAPSNVQSYNRYSYIWNNPLNATDPSGFVHTQYIGRGMRVAGSIAFAAVATYVCNAVCGSSVWAWAAAMAYAGAGSAMIAGADMAGVRKSALSGAVSGMLGTAVMSNIRSASIVERAYAAGVVGGIASVAGGGNFGHGFLSSFVTVSLSKWTYSSSQPFVSIARSAVIGGSVSRMTGGKFANGALSGAFSVAASMAGQRTAARQHRLEWMRANGFSDEGYPLFAGEAVATGPVGDVLYEMEMSAQKGVDTRLVNEGGCAAPICKAYQALYNSLTQDQQEALASAINGAEDLDNVYFHYTDRNGYRGIIGSQGVIAPGADGLVYLTTDMLSPSEVHNSLFMGAPGYEGKGSHIFALEVFEGVPLRPGTQPNEVTHAGALRNGRHVKFLYGGKNPIK
ncbi:RHS repeat domain-containing protein [Agaribacterium haliotis]|uniref:RHS repeat domain-containing protein n=1 Tax=Agaribacterium haliotis TaxID=2013869 RepID=UPI0013044919|nr:RHS repeat-associated core domain-containing protein [Agaribacterium haliotis]